MASGARKGDVPAGLAALYARTRLNVHPPRYDAFGMSIVEAAAFGAPTVFTCVEINQCVGCTQQFFTKSFLGDDAAVLAPSSGEESRPPPMIGPWEETRCDI